MDCKLRIGIGSDHAGFPYKEKMIPYLKRKGYEVVDFGTCSTESVDYPDIAHPLAEAVESGAVDCAVAMCGTGNGMAITLNKHKGVRAGLAWNTETGRLVKAHNNANILVMPARFISYRMAISILRTWLSTPFEGGRHLTRISKI